MSNGEVKYVFVCGLHHSGTTMLARQIGKLQHCTAFENTGVFADEGQYLQDVYPIENSFGGAGIFGFDPRAHLAEASPLLTAANVTRLRKSWENYWDPNRPIRVEKTPSNLLMTRFLQAAFENSYFVVIKRHPVPVSLATQKWPRSPLHRMFDHWLRCYELFDGDKAYLKNLYELRYEDYIANPGRYVKEIAAFIGTEPPPFPVDEVSGTYNAKYLHRWSQMLNWFPLSIYYRQIAAEYERRFAAHGYSLADPEGRVMFVSHEHFSRPGALGKLLRATAQICILPWWLWQRVEWRWELLKQKLSAAPTPRQPSGSGRSPGPAL
jgi:hypothetical protein